MNRHELAFASGFPQARASFAHVPVLLGFVARRARLEVVARSTVMATRLRVLLESVRREVFELFGAGENTEPDKNSRDDGETEAFEPVRQPDDTSSPESTERLFVYGTLMPECANHRQIQRHVRHAVPGSIEGILVDLGAFPALLPGVGVVKGVLIEIDAEALAITDRIEGYSHGREHCLYVRKRVEVHLDSGGTTTAWTYEFADPGRIADRPQLIVKRVAGREVHAWEPNRGQP
jgi:gamma-glutamylcyclotransferase (GGCT)/AIG2-like uncharacterized protein YtfP